jgi:hypothetical protein
MSSWALLAVLLAATPGAEASDSDTPPPYPRISVQIDPIPFAFGGYSTWLGIAPAPHWNVLVGSFAGDALGEFEGWKARIRVSQQILVAYFPDEGNRGFYFAGGVGVLQWSLRKESDIAPSEAEFDQVVFTPMLGYRWYGTDALYLEPFFAAGVPLLRREVTTVEDGRSRQPFTDLLLPGIFLGWTF